MGLRQSYTKEFQNAIVSKVLNRGDRTIAEVCEQEGINKGTVSNWLKIRARVGDMPKQKSSRKSSAEYKLKTIIETHNLSDVRFHRSDHPGFTTFDHPCRYFADRWDVS